MKKIILTILYILFLFTHMQAQIALPPAYEITSDTVINQEIDTTYRQMLEDREGMWNIIDVSKMPLKDKFSYNGLMMPHADKTIGAYWFRYRLKNKLGTEWSFLLNAQNEIVDFYILRDDGNWQHFVSGFFSNWERKDGFKAGNYVEVSLKANEEITVYQRIGNSSFSRQNRIPFTIAFSNTNRMLKEVYADTVDNKIFMFPLADLQGVFFIGFLFFAAFFNSFFYAVSREKMFLYFTLFVLFTAIHRFRDVLVNFLNWGYTDFLHFLIITIFSWAVSFIFLFLFFREAFKIFVHYPKWDKVLRGIFFIYGLITIARISASLFWLYPYQEALYIVFLIVEIIGMEALFCTLILYVSKKDPFTRQVIIGGLPIIFLWSVITIFSSTSLLAPFNVFPKLKIWLDINIDLMQLVGVVWFILFFSWVLFMRFNLLKKESAQKSLDNERLAKEKEIERNELILKQNIELENLVEERTIELNNSLKDLKLSQAQLIQSEKMASLGELTAGIAHEIQNPLNFVNNFSEVSNELIVEMNEELDKGEIEEAKAISADIKQNLEKINHHGKRASDIVKGMLEHSRTSTGQKESIDINALCGEYLRLAYQGFKAKNKDFNAKMETHFDPNLPKIAIIPQDIGRVMLNLINNAFYAVNEHSKDIERAASPSGAGGKGGQGQMHDYVPSVSITTQLTANSQLPTAKDQFLITVKDNGSGIPETIKDKIFQPFFTTKPTGQGTGLGLSLSYDIVKAHGGELKLESQEGEGTKFIIVLPI